MQKRTYKQILLLSCGLTAGIFACSNRNLLQASRPPATNQNFGNEENMQEITSDVANGIVTLNILPKEQCPSWRIVQELSRVSKYYMPTAAAPMQGLDQNRVAALVRMRKQKSKDDENSFYSEYALYLMILKKQEEQWQLEQTKLIYAWDEGMSLETSIPASMEVGDFNRDGQLEIMVRYRYRELCCSVGTVVFTDFVILKVENTSKELLKAGLHKYYPEVSFLSEVTGKLTYADIDGDGDDDLIIDYHHRSSDFDDDQIERFTVDHYQNRYLWGQDEGLYKEFISDPSLRWDPSEWYCQSDEEE